MHSKSLSWPRVLFAGCAALLITSAVSYGAERQSAAEAAAADPILQQLMDNHPGPPESMAKRDSLTGAPDLSPVRLNRTLRSLNPTKPFATGNNPGILPHPNPRVLSCAAKNVQSEFEFEHPGLQFEDWEDNNRISNDNVSGCFGFCDRDDTCDCIGGGGCVGGRGCFDPGDIEDGVTINHNGPARAPSANLVLLLPGFGGWTTSESLIANFFADGIIYHFDDPLNKGNSVPVNAFGGDYTEGGSGATAEVTATLSTMEQVQLEWDAGRFQGFCCVENIISVEVFAAAGTTLEYVDNMQFGTSGTCETVLAPVTLPDLHDSLESLELKLDNLGL